MESIADLKKELDATKAQLDHLAKWCSKTLHYRSEAEIAAAAKAAKTDKDKKAK